MLRTLPPPEPSPVAQEAHDRLVERTRRSLLARSAPRLQMTFMVSATGLAGLSASVLLRRLGLERMGLRYALAVACAYAVFLLLLWLWLAWQGRPVLSRTGRASAARERRRDRGSGPDGVDLVDLSDLAGTGPGEPAPAPWTSGSGRFSGGGASGDLPAVEGPRLASSSGSGSFSSGGGGGGGSLDLDEALAVVLFLAALLGLLLATGYVVFQAPTLLADLLVDGALSAGLYRRLRGTGQGSWWKGAVKRTVLPALVILVLFALAGWAIQSAWPEAHTLGEAWRLLGS